MTREVTTVSFVHLEQKKKSMSVTTDVLKKLGPKSIEVNANHVCEAVNEPVSMIVDAVRNTLERTPPELSADIMDRGIVMTGGSSMLRNLDRLISQETGMPVFVSDEALNCVALGTGMAVENIDIHCYMSEIRN